MLTLSGHFNPLVGAAFSPDGTRLATCDNAGLVKVWDGTPLTALEEKELARD